MANDSQSGSNRERQALIFGLCAVLLWSTVATGFKLGLELLEPAQLLFLGTLVSWLLFAVLAAVRKTYAVARGEIITVAGLGVVNPFLYYLILFEAYDRDARYAVLLDRDGFVTEGRGWNIFALRAGELLSPDRGVLEGMTRRTVLELSAGLNIKGRLGRMGADDLRGADEVFLTSTAGGIMPVTCIDGEAIGDGKPGPATGRLTELYWARHDDPAWTTPVDYG